MEDSEDIETSCVHCNSKLITSKYEILPVCLRCMYIYEIDVEI
jgi:hypothetical protein